MEWWCKRARALAPQCSISLEYPLRAGNSVLILNKASLPAHVGWGGKSFMCWSQVPWWAGCRACWEVLSEGTPRSIRWISRYPYKRITWAFSSRVFWNMLICKLAFAVKQALIILTRSHYVSQTTVLGNVALSNEADLYLQKCIKPPAHNWSIGNEPSLFCGNTSRQRHECISRWKPSSVEIRDSIRN